MVSNYPYHYSQLPSLPWHVFPSSAREYPLLHEQMYEPIVLLQLCWHPPFETTLPIVSWHSFTSKKDKRIKAFNKYLEISEKKIQNFELWRYNFSNCLHKRSGALHETHNRHWIFLILQSEKFLVFAEKYYNRSLMKSSTRLCFNRFGNRHKSFTIFNNLALKIKFDFQIVPNKIYFQYGIMWKLKRCYIFLFLFFKTVKCLTFSNFTCDRIVSLILILVSKSWIFA